MQRLLIRNGTYNNNIAGSLRFVSASVPYEYADKIFVRRHSEIAERLAERANKMLLPPQGVRATNKGVENNE